MVNHQQTHLPETTVTDDRHAEIQARERAHQLREFYTHAGVYVVVIGFLFVLNAIVGSGWWFYWGALGWGIGLAVHALVVFGQEGLFGRQWEERKVREWTRDEASSSRMPPATPPGSTVASQTTDARLLIEIGIDQVAGVRRVALSIASPEIRARAFRICETADNILVALAEEGKESRLARDFLDRYLAPTSTIVTQYARLSTRGVTSAHETLDHVEHHDLPLIEQKLGEFYERIHRGDVIDLQVASEMLETGLIDRNPMMKKQPVR